MNNIRRNLWLWGHDAGSHNGQWGLPGVSRMTPAEAAHYMNIPNVILVEYAGKPTPPYRQYAKALSSCGKVVWSVVGAGDRMFNDSASPLEDILPLAEEFPNITGVMMDDFFTIRDDQNRPCRPRATIAELEQLRRGLRSRNPPLDLWVVVYDYQVERVPVEYLELCDVINYWVWKADDLKDGIARLNLLKKRIPHKRFVLGHYMWDYGNNRPIDIKTMEDQCRRGLELLKNNEVEGLVFLASCICDLDIEAVEWTRTWIREIGA